LFQEVLQLATVAAGAKCLLVAIGTHRTGGNDTGPNTDVEWTVVQRKRPSKLGNGKRGGISSKRAKAHFKIILWITCDKTTLGNLCCSSVALQIQTSLEHLVDSTELF
jgi:hypothetical protein